MEKVGKLAGFLDKRVWLLSTSWHIPTAKNQNPTNYQLRGVLILLEAQGGNLR